MHRNKQLLHYLSVRTVAACFLEALTPVKKPGPGEWVKIFVRWYNGTHRHSGLKYVTPEQRHRGQDTALLEARSRLYLKARERNPERWSGDIRNWKPVATVTLNPSATETKKEVIKKAA